MASLAWSSAVAKRARSEARRAGERPAAREQDGGDGEPERGRARGRRTRLSISRRCSAAWRASTRSTLTTRPQPVSRIGRSAGEHRDPR